MPSPVNPRPTPATLASLQVGKPVSSAHGRRAAQELNYLRAHAVQAIGEAQFPQALGASTSASAYLLYRKTPGVVALRVCAKFHHGDVPDSLGGYLRLAVAAGSSPNTFTTLPDPSPTPIANFIGTVSDLWTASTFQSLPNADLREHEEHVAFVDVSAFDEAETYVVRITYTAEDSSNDGLWSWSLHEVPLATVDPVAAPTTEPGVNEAEPDSRNRIYQGTSGGKGGLLRVWSELDAARSEVRRHAQTGRYCTRNSTSLGALEWQGSTGYGSGNDPKFVVRARKLYAAGTTNAVAFKALYVYDPTYATLTNSKLRVTVDSTPFGGATTTTFDLPLTDSGTNFALGSVAASLPTDGTGQLCEVTFSAQTSNTDGVSTTSDPVLVFALALIEDEA